MTITNLLQRGTIAAFSITLTTIGLPTISHAATLTFDDLLSPEDKVFTFADLPTDYAGFTWNNFGYDSSQIPNSGYVNAVVSPDTLIFNSAGAPATVSRTQAFNLNSAYLTGAWNNGLNILVEGFSGATQTYSRSVTVNTTAPTLVSFDFLGVDRVRFSSSGGTNAGFSSGRGTHFALDNFTFTDPQPTPDVQAQAVPEPMTIAGLALAGTGFAAARRKRQAVKS